MVQFSMKKKKKKKIKQVLYLKTSSAGQWTRCFTYPNYELAWGKKFDKLTLQLIMWLS